MRFEGNTRINTPSASALQMLDIGAEFLLGITVSHFPPGTSQWNKIEHRLFCHITQNWRGKPLIAHEVIVKLIANTTTTKGLKVKAALDKNRYTIGRKVNEDELAQVRLTKADFHSDWNYTISPHSPR